MLPCNQCNQRCLRSACAHFLLNINNADYVLGKACTRIVLLSKMVEELLNKLLFLFSLRTKNILVAKLKLSHWCHMDITGTGQYRLFILRAHSSATLNSQVCYSRIDYVWVLMYLSFISCKQNIFWTWFQRYHLSVPLSLAVVWTLLFFNIEKDF